jgi:hypothetical protein
MSNDTLAPTAPVSFLEFRDAIAAARGASPITERQRHALENPPAHYVIDELDAERDGYFGCRGRTDTRAFAAFILKNHDLRVGNIEEAVASLRDKQALSVERIEWLGREIAPLREIPAALAALLDLGRDPPAAIAADRFEAAAKRIATEAQRNQRARSI